MSNTLYFVGPLGRLSRQYCKINISSSKTAEQYSLYRRRIFEYEKLRKQFPNEFLNCYSDIFGLPANELIILNNPDKYNAVMQSHAVYTLFEFITQQTSVAPINIILALIRHVSGYVKPRDFADKLQYAYENTYGFHTNVEPMETRIVSQLETSIVPSNTQLLFYSAFLRINPNALTFWNTPATYNATSDEKKEYELFCIYWASCYSYVNEYLAQRD